MAPLGENASWRISLGTISGNECLMPTDMSALGFQPSNQLSLSLCLSASEVNR
jgi:hypothetical protein